MSSKGQLFGSKAARILLAAFSTATLATAAAAHEGDHWPVAGEKLRLSWGNSGGKFSFKTKKQISINPVSLAENPMVEGGTLIVRGLGGTPESTELIYLDPDLWSQIGSVDDPKGWEYRGTPYSGQGVSKIQIKTGKTDGSLQIQAKGYDWPFLVTSAHDPIEIVLAIGEFAYCAEFSTERQAEFKSNEPADIRAQYSLAPSECPAVCGNGILEIGEECDDGNDFDNDTCTNACLGCNPADADFATTYEGIQELIFDSPTYNCTNAACHGADAASAAGNLDLRAGTSHAGMLNVDSNIDPGIKRVFPGDQDLSMLYLKLAEKTLGTVDAPGTSMPQSAPALTVEHLEAIRMWIRGGAPETGVVEGTAELLESCLPPPTPLDIPQPPIPDPSAGTQFAMPAYDLLSGQEVEGCVASYYDVSATVPPSDIVDCPYTCDAGNQRGQLCDPMAATPCTAPGACVQMFLGTNPGGQCFSYRGNELYQDAQSHHSIVHIYPGAANWNDAGWGSWRCYGGPTPDAACDPTTADPCGTASGGVCGGHFHAGVACLDTLTEDWGSADFNTSDAPQFSGSQETTANFNFPPGVYSVLPVKGLIVWNSHAFNLTNQDTEMESWINIGYTSLRTWPAQGLFDSQWIFTQNVPPFERREYCATHTFAEGTHLFQLTSHTHKRGVRWRYYDAPQTPCSAPGGTTNPACVPSGSLLDGYESYDYSDPLTLHFDPPKVFSGSVADRTIKFCSLFDNGFTDPQDVKKQSTSPVPTGNLIIGGPCNDSVTFCLEGTNQGAPCNGNDAVCTGGGTCDACTLLGGVTTEDEMYISIGTFYIDP